MKDKDPKVLCEWWHGVCHCRLRRPRVHIVLEVKRDWKDKWVICDESPLNIECDLAIEMALTGARILAERLDHNVAGWTEGYHAKKEPVS